MKKFILILIIFFLIGCEQEYRPVFKYDKKTQEILFKIDEQYLGLKLYEPRYIRRLDTYVNDAYTLSVGKPSSNMHLEYLDVYHDVTWNGLSRSFYESFFKEELKLKSLKIIQRHEVNKNYELSSYLVNKKYRLDLIYIFDSTRETFILDGSGKLFNFLAHKLNVEDEIVKEYPRYLINFDKSLTEYNRFKHYFHIGN